jgi:hypothetical protein
MYCPVINNFSLNGSLSSSNQSFVLVELRYCDNNNLNSSCNYTNGISMQQSQQQAALNVYISY